LDIFGGGGGFNMIQHIESKEYSIRIKSHKHPLVDQPYQTSASKIIIDRGESKIIFIEMFGLF